MPDSNEITLNHTFKRHLFKDIFLFGFSGFLALGKPVVTSDRTHILPEKSYFKIWKDSFSSWFEILTLASSVLSGTQNVCVETKVVQESEGLQVLCQLNETKITIKTNKADNLIEFDLDLYNCVQLINGFQEGILSPFVCSPLTTLRMPIFLKSLEAHGCDLENPDLVLLHLSELFPLASFGSISEFATDIQTYKKEIEILFNFTKFLNSNNLKNYI